MKDFKLIRKLTVLLLISMFTINLAGQNEMSLYGLRLVPQSSYSNPAFSPNANFVIGIPMLSGISGGIYNTAFSFDELFKKKINSDSLFLNFAPVINKNAGMNFATGYAENDVLFMGFKTGKTFISFGIKQLLLTRLSYSDDFIRLLWEGNTDEANRTLDLSNSNFDELHLMAYHLGIAFPAGQKINIGFRLNLLQGLSNIQFEKDALQFSTFNDNDKVYRLLAKSDILVNTSQLAPLGISDSTQAYSFSNYFLDFHNLGFSLDAGIDIQLSERVKMNASILDLGSINWNYGTKSYSLTDDSIVFTGLAIDVINDKNFLNTYIDSLKNLVNFKRFSKNYSTSFPARMMLGLEYYSLDKTNRLSFLYSGRFLKNNFQWALTFAYDKKLSKHVTYKLSYTYLKYAPLNFGAGIVFDFKPFQFYVLTDNVFDAVFPAKQRYFQLSFGINIIIPTNEWYPSETLAPPPKARIPLKKPEIIDF